MKGAQTTFVKIMADQKFNTAPRSAEDTPNPSIQRPLFDEEPLDLETHGGLVVLETGQIAEATPTSFIPEGGDTSLEGRRVQPLPFYVVDTGEGRVIYWREQAYDQEVATIGLEAEHPTMDDYEGTWHHISPDGRKIVYPGDRDPDNAERRGHQPEFLKNTTESGSPVKNLSHGYKDFAERTRLEKENKRRWGIHNGMIFVPVSSYPEMVTEEDITEHPYIQMLRHHELMPCFLEYAACTSEQINIQWKNPEAGSFAINGYQILQSVLNLVTSAAPGRDGSLGTTLREHYADNPVFASAGNPEAYRELAELVHMELGPFMDRVPYDWRELERAYGSPSGGVIQEPAPVDLESFLRLADRQLRDSQTMTIGRALGWHTDRWRPDREVVEICNISHAGDHPEKMPAAEEMVIKTIQALQEYFDDPRAEERYDDNWASVIPRPEERRDIHSRKRFVDVSRTNNLLVAVFGKDRNLFDADWNETTPREIFNIFVDFVNCYASEPISTEAAEEIRATLQHPPPIEEFYTMNDVIAAFYRKGSNMTATEAMRMAKEKDNNAPEILPRHVMQRMTHVVNRIHRERNAALKREQATE